MVTSICASRIKPTEGNPINIPTTIAHSLGVGGFWLGSSLTSWKSFQKNIPAQIIRTDVAKRNILAMVLIISFQRIKIELCVARNEGCGTVPIGRDHEKPTTWDADHLLSIRHANLTKKFHLVDFFFKHTIQSLCRYFEVR